MSSPIVAALAALSLAACDARSASRPFPTRVVDAPDLAWGATSAERFALPDMSMSMAGARDDGAGGSAAAGGSGLSWEAPEGWRRGADRNMRAVTYHPEGDDACECYVTILPGDAGGELANVNRWRGQLGAAPLSAAELDALETLPVLGGRARLVDVEGVYRGMGGENAPGSRLLGVVRTIGGRTVFVKMVGQSATVDANRSAFAEFCRSLEVAE